jgi:hypothetical protein
VRLNVIQSSPVHTTEVREGSGSDQVITEPQPLADEVSAKSDVARIGRPAEIPEERRDDDRIFLTNPPDKLQGENPPSHRRQNLPIHRQLLSADAALRARVQKECGPIVFPALRRHCVATFGIQHR